MADRQIYELTSNASADATYVFATQIADGSVEAGKNTGTEVKAALSLNNVDNTSDVDKPISDATQTALDLKQNALTVKVTMTSAEILAAFTTPKTLVISQGAGTFINVLSVAFRLNFNTIAYATNTTLRLEIGSFSPIVATNTILASSSNDFIVTSATQSVEVSGTPDWVDIPLTAKVLTGNPTAGNSTLDIYITYNVLSL